MTKNESIVILDGARRTPRADILIDNKKPGLFSQLNRDYFRRIETMEFAIRHDDGHRIDELRQAEVVLLGVSQREEELFLLLFLFFLRDARFGGEKSHRHYHEQKE